MLSENQVDNNWLKEITRLKNEQEQEEGIPLINEDQLIESITQLLENESIDSVFTIYECLKKNCNLNPAYFSSDEKKVVKDFYLFCRNLRTSNHSVFIDILSIALIMKQFSIFMYVLNFKGSNDIKILSEIIENLYLKQQLDNELYSILLEFMWQNNNTKYFLKILVELYPQNEPFNDKICLRICQALEKISMDSKKEDILIKFVDKFINHKELIDELIIYRLLGKTGNKVVNHLINNHIELVKSQIEKLGIVNWSELIMTQNKKFDVHHLMRPLHRSIVLQLAPYLTLEQLNQPFPINTYRGQPTILMLEINNPCNGSSLIEFLIQKFNNEHLKVRDSGDNTAIHYIAKYYIPKAMRNKDMQLSHELLVVSKVDAETILIKNKDGDDAIHLAIKNGRFYFAQLLIERLHELSNGQVLLNNKDAGGESYLSLLINTDKVAIDTSPDRVNADSLSFLLMSRGAIHPQGYNLLQFAIFKRNYNIANTFLKHNKNINDGQNIDKPLSLALRQGNWNFALRLLVKGADVTYLFEQSNKADIASQITDDIDLNFKNVQKSIKVENLGNPEVGSRANLIYCRQLIQNIHLIQAIQKLDFDQKQDLIIDILKLAFYKHQDAKELYNFTYQKILNNLKKQGISVELFTSRNELYVIDDPFKSDAVVKESKVDSNIDEEDELDSPDEEQATQGESKQSVKDSELKRTAKEGLTEERTVERPEGDSRQNNADDAEPTEFEEPSASSEGADQLEREDASLKWLLLTGAAHFALRGLEIIRVTSVISYAVSIDGVSNSIHSSYHDTYNNYYGR